jgi:uncharacterized protein DUF4159
MDARHVMSKSIRLPGLRKGWLPLVALALSVWVAGEAAAQGRMPWDKPKPKEPPKKKPAEPRYEDEEDDEEYDDADPDETKPAAKKRVTVVTDKVVGDAIGKAIAWLRKTQAADGRFIGRYESSYSLGETAMALLAMRYGGVSLEDRSVARGMKLLLEGKSEKVYVNSLIAQVLATVPRNGQTPAMKRKLKSLSSWLSQAQNRNGMWTYHLVRQKMANTVLYKGDNSNTQFAALALWQLSEAGIEPSVTTLRRCEKHFFETQRGDGGWGYIPKTKVGDRTIIAPSTPSMSATGLATMYIFQDLLHAKGGKPCRSRRMPAGGRNADIAKRVADATRKVTGDLGKQLNVYRSKVVEAAKKSGGGNYAIGGLDMNALYYLYSIERVAAASGSKHFGSIDWYDRGARLLLSDQADDGSWGRTATVMRAGQGPRWPIAETAFGVLFLAKGRAPIFINKLRYSGDWNNDSRDAANMARYAGRALERHFNWQTIDVASKVDGWLEAPMVMFSGTKSPKFASAEEKKLVQYIDKGGCLLAVATCRNTKFVQGVKKLGTALWPKLSWQLLPKNHPLMTKQSHFDLKAKPKLWALENADGFAFFILSETDVACSWHQNALPSSGGAFQFGINLHRYASRGKPIRPRLAK